MAASAAEAEVEAEPEQTPEAELGLAVETELNVGAEGTAEMTPQSEVEESVEVPAPEEEATSALEVLPDEEAASTGKGAAPSRTTLDSMGVAPVEVYEREDEAGPVAEGVGAAEEVDSEFYEDGEQYDQYEPTPIELTPVEEMENDPNMVYASKVIQKAERGRQARKYAHRIREVWMRKKEEDRLKRKEQFSAEMIKEAEFKAMEERALSRVEGGEEAEKAADRSDNSDKGSESGSAAGNSQKLSDDELSGSEDNEAAEQRQRADKAEAELLRVKEQLLEQSRKISEQGSSMEKLRSQIGIYERKVEDAEARAATSDATREKDSRRVQAVIVALENSVQRLLNEKEDAEAELLQKTSRLKESLERNARMESRETAAREALDDVKANMQVLQDNEEELLMKLRQAQRKNDELRSHQEKETGNLKEKLARATRARHSNLEKRIDTLFTLKGGLDALLDQMQEDAGREPMDYQERSIATRFPKVSPTRRRDYKSKGALSPSSPATRGHAPPHRVVEKTRLPHIPTV